MINAASAIRLLGGPRSEALARAEEARERAMAARDADGVTLRDVRRAIARGSEHLTLRWYADALGGARALDRLIGRYGPAAPAAEVLSSVRAGADRTDHAVGADAPISDGAHTDPDAASHGGDGNSGECQHFAATSAEDRVSECAPEGAAEDTPDGQSPDRGPDGRCAATGTGEEDSDHREGSGQPTGQGEEGGDEPTREMGTHRGGCRVTSDDATAADRGPAKAGGDDSAASERHGAPLEGAVRGDVGAPVADLARARRTVAAARLVAALRQMVEMTCAPRGQATPRYDARRLVRELVSRRIALHRARREDAEIRDIVIAVDTSQSCEHVVEATWRAAVVAASMLPRGRVSVVAHTNARCVRAVSRDLASPWMAAALIEREQELRMHYYSRRQRDASEAVWRAVAARRPGLVLWLGDLDSDWAHEICVSAGVRSALITWLDDADLAMSKASRPAVGGVHDLASAASAAERLAGLIASRPSS